MCAVEQRLARQAHNLEVVGSIPAGAIKIESKDPRLNREGFLLRETIREDGTGL